MEVLAADITGLFWMKVSKDRGCQLGIRRAEGPTVNYLGFREKVHFEQLGAFLECRVALKQPVPQEINSSIVIDVPPFTMKHYCC
jgi:hypothetical protein